ncbi:response regulator [Pedobacter sp. UYP1]|uniref:response regulator n=1 Tax=Pedobacter sp. UYP1 TaxID=1756396 RepID=UPI0033921888
MLLVYPTLYVINIQYCLLVISASYYILGSKSGFRYAIAAILPLLTGILFNDFLKQSIPSTMINVNYTAYGITVLINFALILYIHHLFFKSLTKFKKRELLFKKNLEQAAANLREQAMAKTNFLNSMSHEIRTPLNAIVGMSNLLLSGSRSAEQDENLQILNFSAENLMATVNDIVDFSSLDNEKIQLHKKPFRLYQTIKNVFATFEEEATSKLLNFDLLIDEKLKNKLVIGDELRLSQILFHLIGNAIKFTKHGFVNVGVTCSEEPIDKTVIKFKIDDSGIGISEEMQQQLMDPFKKKLQRSQRQYQTTLGMTIASLLLKLHGSQLEINSRESKGSCFSFDIIYTATEMQEKSIPVSLFPLDANLSELRLLAVDDERLNLLVVKKILAKWGVVADEAVNGKVALEMCIKKDYDVVLMDINMPIMDGFEASRAIKDINKKDFTPPWIIALTASVGSSIEEVIQFPTIDDCILKPFRPEELRYKLSQLNDKMAN